VPRLPFHGHQTESLLSGPASNPAPGQRGEDRRRAARTRVTQTIRVRPSLPQAQNFDDVARTLNASRTGLYFKAWRDSYFEDMRLFVTYPYATGPGVLNREFAGRVVRVDQLADGRRGIAVELLSRLDLVAGDAS